MESVYYCFYIIRINMEDGRRGYFCDICTIYRGARVEIVCSKCHLVIHYDMYGTSCFITIECHHLSDLIYDALTCDSAISVDNDRENFMVIVISIINFRTADALYERSNGLQVGRVRHEINDNLFTLWSLRRMSSAQVIFNIAGENIFKLLTFELGENLFVGLPEDIGEHAETTTVCHT